MQTVAITQELCAERIGAVLRRWALDMRFAATIIGRKIGADPRVMENYMRGIHWPPVTKLIALMAECEELEKEVLELVRLQREATKG